MRLGEARDAVARLAQDDVEMAREQVVLAYEKDAAVAAAAARLRDSWNTPSSAAPSPK